jgi:hypothetical protein
MMAWRRVGHFHSTELEKGLSERDAAKEELPVTEVAGAVLVNWTAHA